MIIGPATAVSVRIMIPTLLPVKYQAYLMHTPIIATVGFYRFACKLGHDPCQDLRRALDYHMKRKP